MNSKTAFFKLIIKRTLKVQKTLILHGALTGLILNDLNFHFK